MPTRCNRWFLLQILLLAQHVSGTTMPIIRGSRVLYRWLLPAAAARKPDTQPSAPHHTDNVKTKTPNTTGSNHLYSTLELLMVGITVPETCWASNKICNKNHLLHLVGILFTHIKDDARSKPHQIYMAFKTLKFFQSSVCSWYLFCSTDSFTFVPRKETLCGSSFHFLTSELRIIYLINTIFCARNSRTLVYWIYLK